MSQMNNGILWCYMYAVCTQYNIHKSVFHCSISLTVTVLSCDFCEPVNEVKKMEMQLLRSNISTETYVLEKGDKVFITSPTLKPIL